MWPCINHHGRACVVWVYYNIDSVSIACLMSITHITYQLQSTSSTPWWCGYYECIICQLQSISITCRLCVLHNMSIRYVLCVSYRMSFTCLLHVGCVLHIYYMPITSVLCDCCNICYMVVVFIYMPIMSIMFITISCLLYVLSQLQSSITPWWCVYYKCITCQLQGIYTTS